MPYPTYGFNTAGRTCYGNWFRKPSEALVGEKYIYKYYGGQETKYIARGIDDEGDYKFELFPQIQRYSNGMPISHFFEENQNNGCFRQIVQGGGKRKTKGRKGRKLRKRKTQRRRRS